MKVLREALAWVFIRLPLAFSLPFLAMSLWWVFYGFKPLNDVLADPAAKFAYRFLEAQLPELVSRPLIANLGEFIHAVIVIGLFFLGLLVAYNLAAFVNWIPFVLGLKPIPYAYGAPQIPPSESKPDNPFADVQRIGIVLAGGGAKGAYQAGAMKAIYHFLAQHDALRKVTVIAATSIGSWNALFWLAHLIKPAGKWGGRSVHEQWWRSISAKSLGAPSWYVPFLRNAFLSSLPWQQVFDRIFDRTEIATQLEKTGIHFYLTRSNVRTGELECATNNPNPPVLAHVSYEILDARVDAAKYLADIKIAVFASMDLPPLFPYIARGDKLYEDGGVVDNLPIAFPASREEACDLIFILPLNSDFEEEPNRTSIVARLLRVMDVRQGVLERTGFKMLYLYNELAALREHARPVTAVQPGQPGSSPLNFALQRKNEQISVFAICPLKSFVQATIDTRELWKSAEAGIAFDVMHEATASELPGFKFKPQDKVRVALVSRGGHITWDERF